MEGCTQRKYRAKGKRLIIHLHGNVLSKGCSFLITDKKGLVLYQSKEEIYDFNEALKAAKSLIDFKHGYVKSEYVGMLLRGQK